MSCVRVHRLPQVADRRGGAAHSIGGRLVWHFSGRGVGGWFVARVLFREGRELLWREHNLLDQDGTVRDRRLAVHLPDHPLHQVESCFEGGQFHRSPRRGIPPHAPLPLAGAGRAGADPVRRPRHGAGNRGVTHVF